MHQETRNASTTLCHPVTTCINLGILHLKLSNSLSKGVTLFFVRLGLLFDIAMAKKRIIVFRLRRLFRVTKPRCKSSTLACDSEAAALAWAVELRALPVLPNLLRLLQNAWAYATSDVKWRCKGVHCVRR